MLYTKKSSLEKFPPKYFPTSKSPHIKRPLQKVPSQNDLYKKSFIIKKNLWTKHIEPNQIYQNWTYNKHYQSHISIIYYIKVKRYFTHHHPPGLPNMGGDGWGGPYPMKGLSPHHSLSPPSTTTLKNDDMNNTDDLKIKMSSKRKASSKKKTPINGRWL